MINGLNLARLRNAEFDQFMRDKLQLVQRNDPIALMVEAEFAALKGESDRLSELLNPQRGSGFTKKLEAADLRRDMSISGINLIVAGYLNSHNETLRQHAEALDRHLNLFGKAALARENYQSQTASTKSMLNDWDTNEHLGAAIDALHLTPWKEELAAANQEFADLYLGRTEEAGAANTDTVKGLRQSMIQSYYNLRDMIIAYHTVKKGANPWGQTIKQVNALINQYRPLTGESPINGADDNPPDDGPGDKEQ